MEQINFRNCWLLIGKKGQKAILNLVLNPIQDINELIDIF